MIVNFEFAITYCLDPGSYILYPITMFIDIATIRIAGGRGGDGKVSFRHEQFVARGGPDGGDGGHGGSVVVEADHNMNNLREFRGVPLIRAQDGESGRDQKAHGKSGEDKVIKLPVGTMVYAGDELLADLTKHGARAVVAAGGKGGFGNAHFTSSTRRSPRHAEVGEPGEKREIELELKLIADVGLVGLPNAGKSTFLSVVSNAKPKIADYPFTTLEPFLGVAEFDDTSLLLADIPGLIEGASKGRGLGDAFLRHIERTVLLLHLIEATNQNVALSYETIMNELKSYKVDLTGKPQVIVLTKTDAVDEKTLNARNKELKKLTKDPIFGISSVKQEGTLELLRYTAVAMKKEVKRLEKMVGEPAEVPVLTLEDDPESWRVEKVGRDHWQVKGQVIEGFARRTDMSNPEGLARLRDIMHKKGIDRELVRLGVSLDDTIEIAGKKFEW